MTFKTWKGQGHNFLITTILYTLIFLLSWDFHLISPLIVSFCINFTRENKKPDSFEGVNYACHSHVVMQLRDTYRRWLCTNRKFPTVTQSPAKSHGQRNCRPLRRGNQRWQRWLEVQIRTMQNPYSTQTHASFAIKIYISFISTEMKILSINTKLLERPRILCFSDL